VAAYAPVGKLTQISAATVTIVVVSYNGAHLLPRCLDSLLAQSGVDTPVEITVVDNASTDGTLTLLAERYPSVRVIAAGTNTGFAGGVALALRHSCAPVAVLFNNDAVASPDFLAALLEPFSDPTVGAVCAKVLLTDDRGINSVGAEVTADGFGRDRGWLEPDDGRYDIPTEVFVGSACSLGLRRRAIDEAGGIDEEYFLYYEDIDLTWRLRLFGWSVVTAPKAIVHHEHSATVGSGSPLHEFYSERNRLLTMVKNGSGRLALRAVLVQPLTTLYVAGRQVQAGWRDRRPPDLQVPVARARAWVGFLRLVPHAWRERRQVRQTAVVSRRTLEKRWLAPPALHFGPLHFGPCSAGGSLWSRRTP
jgi:GT2 family glycosyltransferase